MNAKKIIFKKIESNEVFTNLKNNLAIIGELTTEEYKCLSDLNNKT